MPKLWHNWYYSHSIIDKQLRPDISKLTHLNTTVKRSAQSKFASRESNYRDRLLIQGNVLLPC